MLPKGKELLNTLIRNSGTVLDAFDLLKHAISNNPEQEEQGSFEQPSLIFQGELSKEQEQQSMYFNTLEVFKQIKNFLYNIDLTLPFDLDKLDILGENGNQIDYNFDLDMLQQLQQSLADERQFATKEDQICQAFQTLSQVLYKWLSLQLQQQNSEDKILNHEEYLQQLSEILDNQFLKDKTYQKMRSQIVQAQKKVELTHLQQFPVKLQPIKQTTLFIRNTRNSCLEEFRSYVKFKCPTMLTIFERELVHKIYLTINSILQPYRSIQPDFQNQFYQFFKNEFFDYLRVGQIQVSPDIVNQIMAPNWNKAEIFQQVIRLIKLITKDSEQFGEIQQLIEIQNPEVQFEEYKKCQWQQQVLPLNFKAMTQIFILMSGMTIEKLTIKFDQYCPIRRNILIQIFRIFQEDDSGFLNMYNHSYSKYQLRQLLKILERLAAQLQMNIMKQIQENLNINNENADLFLNIRALNIPEDDVLLRFDNDDLNIEKDFINDPIIKKLEMPGSIGQQLFYIKNAYLDAMRMKDKNLSAILLKQALQQIEISPMVKPALFNIEKISGNLCSKVITLCISGFTSMEEDKVEKWQCLYDQNEVFALHWHCSSENELYSYLGQFLCGVGLRGFNAIPVGLYTIKSLLYNPFTQALKEAEVVGKYLAHLLVEKKIFGDCQVNLIGFSLGTHLIQHCIREMDKLQPEQKVVNNVVFLGGVADAKHISKLRLHSVGGYVWNAYSKNDSILRYLLKLVKFDSKPCGLQEVNSKYEKKIKNKDLSHLINGHMGYVELMDEVLFSLDYENDLKIFYSQ